MKRDNMLKNTLHCLLITLLVFWIMFVGTMIPISLSSLNPFKKGQLDYDYTDLVYCKFKEQNNFDDRIVLVNVNKPERTKIAEAIDSLRNYKARVIGIDVIFEGRKTLEGDSILATAINKTNNLVLGDIFKSEETKTLPHTCDSLFCNKDNVAFVNYVAKPNMSIRYVSPFEIVNDQKVNAFSSAILKKYDAARYDTLSARCNNVEQINYRGSVDSYVQMNISEVLTNPAVASSVKDKIVLMGYLGEGDWGLSIRDKFFTPLNEQLALRSLPDMYGLVIHANVLSMMLDNNYINASSPWVTRIVSFIFVFILVWIFRRFFLTFNPGYFKAARVIQLGIFFALFLLATLLFYKYNYRLNLTLVLVGVVISWDIVKIYQHVFIKKQKPLRQNY